MRLDKAILEKLGENAPSRVRIQEDIVAGKVEVDHKIIDKPSFQVTEKMRIEYDYIPDIKMSESPPKIEDIPLEILFENDEMLVVNKPAGMPTHPDEHYHSGTLVNALLGYFQKNNIPLLERAGIVHRLDKDTSGCLMVAKNEKMHRYLSTLIAERKITKQYIALVGGTLSAEKGTIDAPLTRDPNNRERMITMETKNAKHAITHFDVLERYSHPSFTLVSVHIITGRTHQIRAHFRAIAHPVVEDALYGTKEDFGVGRMFLHASFLEFTLPSGEKITVECPLPEILENFLEKLKK